MSGKPLAEIARDMGQSQEMQEQWAELDRRWKFVEPFDPFLEVDPRITVGDALWAAYRLDVVMTVSRRPSPEQVEAIKAELRRGVQTREYGEHPDLEL
ncbi:MAG: hypothetical protein ACM4D3_24715 [Candidatus Sericytochromatia bacterium]